MAQVVWELSAKDGNLDQALKNVGAKYDKLGETIERTGDRSEKAGRMGEEGARKTGAAAEAAGKQVGGLGGMIEGWNAAMAAAAGGVAVLSKIAQSEFAAMTEAARLYNEQLVKSQQFGDGRVIGGRSASLEIREAVRDLGVSQAMPLTEAERLDLANVMRAANEDVTVEQAVAGVSAAGRSVGALDAQGRQDLVRNMAELQKFDLGLGQDDLADLAMRGVQGSVDFSSFDQFLQRAQALEVGPEGMQQLVSMALSGGKRSERAKSMNSLLDEVARGTEVKPAQVSTVRGVTRVVPGGSDFASADEALAALLADPSRLQNVGLTNAMRDMVPVSELVAGDSIREAVGAEDPLMVNRLREREFANASLERERMLPGARAFENETENILTEAQTLNKTGSAFIAGGQRKAREVTGPAIEGSLGVMANVPGSILNTINTIAKTMERIERNTAAQAGGPRVLAPNAGGE